MQKALKLLRNADSSITAAVFSLITPVSLFVLSSFYHLLRHIPQYLFCPFVTLLQHGELCALLGSAGVRLGCLICVDTDGHLEKIPPQTWELVEHILSKQMFVEASHQDKPFETAEDILMHLLDGGFSSAARKTITASTSKRRS